jgi:hypothetical protein
LGIKPALKTKKTYSIVTAILAVCLVLSIYVSLQFSVNASLQDQNPSQTSPSPTIIATAQPTSVPTPNLTTADPTPHPLLTEDEALKLAMPLIEAYASENGRVISSVNVTFCTAFDTEGMRSGVDNNESSTNPADIIAAFRNAPGYPAWSVEAHFTPIEDSHALEHITASEQAHVLGYYVSIWADTGKIKSENVQICR